MALRDQPYFPLYAQDFLSDERLNECTAEATGVYIKLMCVMHKSEEYGKILLKQKDKQSDQPIKNFALKISKQVNFSLAEIERGLADLIENNVVKIEGDALLQKRMVKDNALSISRSKNGKKGGKKTANHFAKAKTEANTVNENEDDNEAATGSKDLKGVQGEIVLKPEEILSRIIENEYKTREFVMKHFGFSVEEFNAVALYFVDKNRDTEDFKQAYPEVLKYFRNWTQKHVDFLRKEVCKREPALKSKQITKTNVSDFKNDYSEAETKVK